MFANLKPYPEYASAAHHSLPDLPMSWGLSKLKRVIELRGGSTPAKERSEFWGGLVPWVTPKDMKVSVISSSIDHVTDLALHETTLSTVAPGAVLIVVRGMILVRKVPTAYVAAPITINQDMKALVPRPLLDGAYLQALLVGLESQLSAVVEVSGHGTRKIDSDSLVNLHIPVPPHADQHAIIRYLAHANGRIDKAIAAKHKMIALLEEQKQAVINHAVTRGTGTSVQLRDSGIPSYGSVPHHWDVRRLGTLISSGPRNGVSPPVDETGDLESLSISVVRSGSVDVQPADIKYVDRSAVGSVADYELRSGDILVVRGNGNIHLVGRAGLVVQDMPGRIYPDLLMRIRLGRTADPAFVVAAFSVPAVRRQIELAARTAVGTYKVSAPDLRQLEIAAPPLREQEAIVNYIASETKTVNAVVARTSREIELLREFKTRLTVDVVTGQIDVREIAATLPDVDPVEAADSVGADGMMNSKK